MTDPVPRTPPTPQEILKRVAAAAGIRLGDLTGPCRSSRFVRARREAVRQLRGALLSLQEIGDLLNRHHTTIMSLLEPGPEVRRAAAARKAFEDAGARQAPARGRR